MGGILFYRKGIAGTLGIHLLAALLLSSCSRYFNFRVSGTQNSAVSKFPDQGRIPNPPAGIQLKYSCSDPSARGLGETGSRRLTTPELSNTLSDLLGTNVMQDSQIQAQLGQLSADHILANVAEIQPNTAQGQPNAMMTLALRASTLLLDTSASRGALLGSCTASDAISDDCARKVITEFGLKVYRRPLTPAEVTSYLASYKDGGSGLAGLKRVFTRLILAPPMTYHLEAGSVDVNSRTRLTDYEIASRISYRVAATAPDTELLQAAAEGKLQILANVEAQTRRLMLASPRARAQVNEFFRVYLQLDPTLLAEPSPSEAAAQGVDTQDLKAEMIQEIQDFYNYIVWTKQGTFKDLLTSTDSFPRSARMARILGAPGLATGNTPVPADSQHAGALLRPASLESGGDRTAIVHRGVKIRKQILCDQLGTPPADAVNARKNAVGDLSLLGNREQLQQLTNLPLCMTCHTQINPLGAAFEGYDQLGMARSTENLFVAGMPGTVSTTRPIDTSVSGLNLEAGAPDKVSSALELVSALAKTTKARACFTKAVFEFMRLRLSTVSDSCALREVENRALDTGSILSLFVINIANEDIFWKAKGG